MKFYMKMFANKFYRKEDYSKTSYSQCGEDLIIDFIFECLKVDQPTYLDLGANHPIKINNTHHFYKKGCRGVLVEPDPELYNELKKTRSKDKCLNAGVGISDETSASFYIMSSRTLNTLNKEEAERICRYGNQKIEKEIQIPLLKINNIIDHYCLGTPDFISLDVEGIDELILRSIDFVKIRPKVFCIETLTYTEDNTEEKEKKIIEFMISKGYFLYADTYINSIFVDKISWTNR